MPTVARANDVMCTMVGVTENIVSNFDMINAHSNTSFASAQTDLSREINKQKIANFVLKVVNGSDELGIPTPSINVGLTAIAVLNLLPKNVALPTISFDETDFIFFWQNGENEDVISVDEHILHFIHNAGGSEVEYFDDLSFDLWSLPSIILQKLQR